MNQITSQHDTDQRNLSRDSLFVMAALRVGNQAREHRVKVRNLSAGGMMAEGPLRVATGAAVSVELRNHGWVEGTVAWVQDTRFGIAFVQEIDPLLARAPEQGHLPDGFELRRPTAVLNQIMHNDPARLRKV